MKHTLVSSCIILIVFLTYIIFPSSLYASSAWINSQDLKSNLPSSVLQVRMNYSQETLVLRGATILEGYVSPKNEFEDDFVIVAKDAIGDELYRKGISLNRQLYSLPPISEAEKSIEILPLLPSNFQLSEVIPWDNRYKMIEIQRPDGTSLSRLPSSAFIRKNNQVTFFTKTLSDSQQDLSANDTLDITFIGDNYTANTLSTFHNDVTRFSNELALFQPFTQYITKIVFHYIDNTTDLGCNYTDRVIVCNSSLVYSIVQNAGVPYDRVAVIVNDPTYGGAAVGELAVMYNGQFGPEGFVHEFGHTFSRLADEYLANVFSESLDRNCYNGTPPNPSWQGIPNVTYFEECNFPDYYRSSSDSIMRTLAAKYFNDVSQKYLRDSLIFYTGGLTPTPSVTSVPTGTSKLGDANSDGKVDGIDYVVWLSHYNQNTSGGNRDGDFNTSGKVDGVDFVIWLNNYGK